jgi:putative transposase
MRNSSDYEQPIFPHLAKDTVLDGLDQLSVTDITYVAIAAGSEYAAIFETWIP